MSNYGIKFKKSAVEKHMKVFPNKTNFAKPNQKNKNFI